MLKKIRNQILKQVDSKRVGFFEGWYFKQVSLSLDVVVSFIPGFSTEEGNQHAFLQYILVKNNVVKSGYVKYPLSDFVYYEDPFTIELGSSFFSKDKMVINFDDNGFKIKGTILFGEFLDIGKSVYAPNIMGPFAYIPFMECYHGLVSLRHELSGALVIDGEDEVFDGGIGYIEKDWGKSFPKKYIWLQCNSFGSGSSLFLSIADIPFGGFGFDGFIGVFHDGKREYRFGSYLRGGYKIVSLTEEVLEVELWRGPVRLFIRVSACGADSLIAPVAGRMSLVIKEAVSAVVEYSFVNKKTGDVFEERGCPGSYEVVGY
ncbi:MAG: tocopherol cyclase family protein [Firmicutes bacterium]|nr:tocopherol cyclase family protein [Bacillota bacterium]